jgi:membrane associated rhomboid family serine protease
MSSSSLSSKINLKRIVNIPPATKFLLGGLTIVSLFLQFLRNRYYNQLILSGEKDVDFDAVIVPALQLIPNHTLLHPWTVLTSIFIDIKVWRYFLSFFITLFAGKFVERSWSGKELIKFVLITGSISNLANSITLIFWNILGFGVTFFNLPVDGNLSILIGFLVVFKQLIPEHSISLAAGFSGRVKHIPFLALLISGVISVVTQSTNPFLQTWLGFLVSWTYLRFFQTNVIDPILPSNSIGVQKLKGDASETFSLVSFFPSVTHVVLTPIFNQFYELSVQLGFIDGFNESDVEQGNLIANRRLTGHNSNSGSSDSRNAAERRRQVALKVLEERNGEDSSNNIAPQQPN